MSAPDFLLASSVGSRLSIAGLLAWLHTQGRLRPLVREALAARVVQDHARQANLTATVEELQTAADRWRRRHSLQSAADTRAWLTARGLSQSDFENALEQDIFTIKLRSHLTADAVEGHFAANRSAFERWRVAQLLVGREDLARELATQVRDEGRELGDVAEKQGLRVARSDRYRKHFAGPLAAAMASAKVGQLIGPSATSRGFALVLVEERRPAELDAATRTSIQHDLFHRWLASQLGDLKVDLPASGAQ